MQIITVIIYLFAFIVTHRCAADLFTAMADMESLLGAEKEVTGVISQYIESELQRLERLKKCVFLGGRDV